MGTINNTGGVDAAMLTATGRDSGPDIVLKVIKDGLALPAVGANAPVNGIINDNSSITEVLNIVAYLTIPDADRTALVVPNVAPPWYDVTHSVGTLAAAPGPTDTNGFYAGGALAALDNTLFVRAAGVSVMSYDLNLMAPIQVLPVAPDIIPVCIRKRNPPAPAANPLQVANVAAAQNSNGNIPLGAPGAAMVSALMSDCVKQMINILENTRNIFGPKGWTALFSQVKGGGGKNHAKHTHRQHRRKYSSKHY
jgi:hypothetical protein